MATETETAPDAPLRPGEVAVPGGELIALGLLAERWQQALAAAVGRMEGAERERDEAKAELAALENRLAAAIAESVRVERGRAEAAEERLGLIQEHCAGVAAETTGHTGIPCRPEDVRVSAGSILAIIANGSLFEAEEFNSGKPVRWSDACPPGGMVCAVPNHRSADGICGMPVESEPCTEHEEVPGA